MKDLNHKLIEKAIKRLEVAAESITKTRGYTRTAAQLFFLKEILKEQGKNENPNPPISKIR